MIRCQLSGELIGDEEGIFTFIYDGVTYRPTDNFQALGILLFGLQPKGFEFHCKTDPRPCQQAMLAAGMEFHRHANGDKWLEHGTLRFTPERLIEWIDAAADLAPTLEAKQDVIKAVMRNLGPFAFDDEMDKPVNR